MSILRKLREEDAVYMVEWMKDPDINRYFLFDPDAVSLESALEFIKEAHEEEKRHSAYHFAIVGENTLSVEDRGDTEDAADNDSTADRVATTDKESTPGDRNGEYREYAGTVSLKKIDPKAKTAEYAISLRKKYHSRGLGLKATKEILRFAFEELKLNRVYLNVVSDNEPAIRMYEKAGFSYEGFFKNHIWIQGEIKSWKWYAILKEDYFGMNDE